MNMKKLVDLYENMLDATDPRVGAWPMMSTILWPISLLIIYFLGFYVIGPKIMQNRRPVNTDRILKIYNPLMVSANLLLSLMLIWYVYKAGYKFGCQRVDYKGGPNENKIAKLIWCYHLIKVIEFFDSAVLSMHKQNVYAPNSKIQIYHHSTMALGTWLLVRFTPGGTVAIIAIINSLVHVAIYAYFRLKRAFGTVTARNFKLFVDELQIVQFALTSYLCLSVIFVPCRFPVLVAYVILIYVIGLFSIIFPGFLRVYNAPEEVEESSETETDDESDEETDESHED